MFWRKPILDIDHDAADGFAYSRAERRFFVDVPEHHATSVDPDESWQLARTVRVSYRVVDADGSMFELDSEVSEE